MVNQDSPINIKFIIGIVAMEGLLLGKSDSDYLGFKLAEKSVMPVGYPIILFNTFLIPRPINTKLMTLSIMSISFVGLDLGDCNSAAILSINWLCKLHPDASTEHIPRKNLRKVKKITQAGIQINKGNIALCPYKESPFRKE